MSQVSPGQRENKMFQFRGGGNKKPYTFASQPHALFVAVRTTQIDRENMCKQIGYTNIMHDKRVVRGSNFAKKTFPNFHKESTASREAEARRRAMARKKAIDYQTRALRLHLGAPKLTKGLQNVDIQTDIHLEELYEYPESQTIGAQTVFDQEPLSNPRSGTSAGTDASTQVDDIDLFDFETEVTPISESLITEAFRQAMLEVLYEDELDVRARQQRTFYRHCIIEKVEMDRAKHEDKNLNKVVDDRAGFNKNNEKIENTRHASTKSNDLQLITANTSDNSINITDAPVVESQELVSWLKKELHAENDEMLKDIVRDLVQRRLDVHNKITEVQNIKKSEELFREIEPNTLQSDQTTNNK
ncbi:Radial spoke 3 [Cinara cedri]|uniref:Radial spoke 3 n=1 Tax=Cinara cedri TaxID=506608 RepID=A0A5E4N454_9HEMI|nr:Radial spoke 3 [Cinara cedri]